VSFWFDDNKRLLAAKQFQVARIQYLTQLWSKDRDLQNEGFDSNAPEINSALNGCSDKIQTANKVG
jgi:CRISPR-associated protein Cas1